LTTLREKLIKIGAKVVSHSGYVIFQMAEVAVPKELFVAILERIGRLWLLADFDAPRDTVAKQKYAMLYGKFKREYLLCG